MEGGYDDPMKAVSESSSGDEKDAKDVEDGEKQTDTVSGNKHLAF